VRVRYPIDTARRQQGLKNSYRSRFAEPYTLAVNSPIAAREHEAIILRVLGLDPALAGATGYGVVESDGRHCRMVRLGALRPARANVTVRKGGTAAERTATNGHEHLCRIHQLVSELIEEFAPHSVAVESVFTALNRQTALRLAEVRGVVLLAAAQKGIPVRSYSPREIKAHVSGYGNAGKEQMQQMVRTLLGLAETPEPADAADALAVALCHIQAAQAESRMAAGFARGGKLVGRVPEAAPRAIPRTKSLPRTAGAAVAASRSATVRRMSRLVPTIPASR
jgi:crossover junction endodeoxyribonuclease RuvC